MTEKHPKLNSKQVAMKVFFIGILMTAAVNKASSQCAYVTSQNGKETKVTIPCDFPLLVDQQLNDGTFDAQKFAKSAENWKLKNNITSTKIVLNPQAPTEYYSFIEIPNSVFARFSSEKKNSIQSYSNFYKITK